MGPLAQALASAAGAFVLTALIVPPTRRLAIRVGAIDRSVAGRPHRVATPRLGGLAIFVAFHATFIAGLLLAQVLPPGLLAHPGPLVAILGGGLAMVALGCIDDRWRCSAPEKLAFQIPVAVLAFWAGIRVEAVSVPFYAAMALPAPASFAVTVLWIVGVTNSFNLIDGLDGLAAGVALSVLGSTAVCALLRDDMLLVALSVPLAGAVAGFLVYNFHPARIFMGDAGSLFLGYTLATAAALSAQKTATVGLLLPVVALGLPFLDTLLAIVRRLSAGRQILKGDVDHIHHRMLALGWSHRRSVLFLYFVTLLFNLLSILLILTASAALHTAIIGASLAVTYALAAWLGYARRLSLPGLGTWRKWRPR